MQQEPKALKNEPFRLAILVADIIADDRRKHFGDIDSWFLNLFGSMSYECKFATYSAWAKQLPDDVRAYDGYLITGSSADAHSDASWVQKLGEFIVTAHKRAPGCRRQFWTSIVAPLYGRQIRPFDERVGRRNPPVFCAPTGRLDATCRGQFCIAVFIVKWVSFQLPLTMPSITVISGIFSPGVSPGERIFRSSLVNDAGSYPDPQSRCESVRPQFGRLFP